MLAAEVVGMCEAPGCERSAYARGLCGRHYKQWQRHGLVQPDPAPRTCAVETCDRRAVTRGWCHGHYLRWSRGGDVRADVALKRPQRDECRAEGCPRGAHSRGYCRTHYRRLHLHGDVDLGGPVRQVTGDGSLSHGYWHVAVPPALRHLVPPGRRSELEHRLVMAARLGRPLLEDELVHHRNGDRLDNRLVNLDLWTTAQPKGQRVEDKLAFAYELLRRYDAEASAALGLALCPREGLLTRQRPTTARDRALTA